VRLLRGIAAREVPLGHFHDRMAEELELRGYAKNTARAYLGAMRLFVKHFMRPPDQLTLEDIRNYQLHLVRRAISAEYFNQIVSALRFFYNQVLRLNWDLARLPYRKRGRDLPVVLSRQEVQALFDAKAYNLKHLMVLKILYADGPRVSELVNLRVSDLDSQRMTIHIRDGKGEKDRFVMLPRDLLGGLRQYYREFGLCPDGWLFQGQKAGRPLSTRSAQHIVKQAAQRAGLTKEVSPHILRHSFATHLVEDGVSLQDVRDLLGHRSISTTARYTHLTKRTVVSPLDRLGEPVDPPPASA